MLDLRHYSIPHDYLQIHEMFGANRVIRTFAPLPSIVAAHHAEGQFPKSYHDRKEPIEGDLKAYDPTD